MEGLKLSEGLKDIEMEISWEPEKRGTLNQNGNEGGPCVAVLSSGRLAMQWVFSGSSSSRLKP